MKTIFVLYDTGVAETIRAFDSMDRAITVAIKRLQFFNHECMSFDYFEEYTVIEYVDHETGILEALTITATTYEEE